MSMFAQIRYALVVAILLASAGAANAQDVASAPRHVFCVGDLNGTHH